MLGETLKNLRSQCLFTQQQLGDLLGIDRSTYSYYESNVTQPTFDTLKKIARIFNVTTDYLLDFQVDTFAPLTANDNDNDRQAEEIDFPERASQLTKDEKKLLLYYRTVEDKKTFMERVESKYYEENGRKNKKDKK